MSKELSVLPCNNVEFALERIRKSCEQIRQSNNGLWHPSQQEALLELVEEMAQSLENTAKWAKHLEGQQSKNILED